MAPRRRSLLLIVHRRRDFVITETYRGVSDWHTKSHLSNRLQRRWPPTEREDREFRHGREWRDVAPDFGVDHTRIEQEHGVCAIALTGGREVPQDVADKAHDTRCSFHSEGLRVKSACSPWYRDM